MYALGVMWKRCIHVVRPGIVCYNQKILFVVGSALLHLPFKARLLLCHQFNIHEFNVMPSQCIYVFYVGLRTDSDYFPMQH